MDGWMDGWMDEIMMMKHSKELQFCYENRF